MCLRGHCVGSVMSRLCVSTSRAVRDETGQGGVEKLMGLGPGH